MRQQQQGKQCNVPAGDYLSNNLIGVTLTSSTNGISVVCDAGATFIKSASFPDDKQLFLFLATSGDQSVSWIGGKLDGRLAPVRASATAPDLMAINGGQAYIKKVYVSDVYFLSNDDRTGTAGDSCLFVAGCDDVSIVNNVFQGAVDLGLYISGQSTTFVGKRIYVAGNKFIECIFGIGSKREYQTHIIQNNFFKNNNICIFIGGETEFANTAQKAIISGNIIENCGRGIESRVSNGAIITGNRIEDFGLSATGTPTNEAGVLVSGSQNCIISDNNIGFSGAFTPVAGTSAVRFASRTLGATTYTPEYNYVTDNSIYNCPEGVVEVTGSGANNNVLINNQFRNVPSNYQVIGANTNYGQIVNLIGEDPVLTIQDTESTVGNANAKIILAESGAGGVIDNDWSVHFDGTNGRQGLDFKYNNVSRFRVNGDTVSSNFAPTTTPSAANAGDVYYDSGTNKLRCYNGTIWNDLF